MNILGKAKPPPISPARPPPRNTPLRIWKSLTTFNWKLATGKSEQQMGDIGVWLKNELVDLGPAFVKMGQFVSTRSDVLPKRISEELKKLQDSITSTPFQEIKSVLIEEYGEQYPQIFSRFDPNPIASASIGQVHRAVLRNGNIPVVVKIQKPYVDDQIRSDLTILKGICQFFKFLQLNGRAAEFESILHQYEDFLNGELDYLTEKDEMLFFKEQLEPILSVVIPQPFADLSTRRILVMEDVPSQKITEFVQDPAHTALKSGDELAEELINLFLYQIIYCGRVHCDPHPGNIGVDATGRLVLYDFGNVADLGPNFKANVQQLVVSVYQKDVDEFMDLILAMKIVQISNPMEILELKNFFIYVFEYLDQVDFQKFRSSVLDNDILKSSNLKVKIQPEFLSLFRVFSLLDGTCLVLNPGFSYLPALQPYFQDILRDTEFIQYRMRRDMQKITAFPKMIQTADNNILQVNRRMERMSGQIQTFQFVCIGLYATQFLAHSSVEGDANWLCFISLLLILLAGNKKDS
jgi:predicted unusual protein kinase regulating ubiquinone biosynthesis (AarF/ABC1/UbiB family)